MSRSANPVQLLLVEDDDVDVVAIQRAFRSMRILNPLAVARDGIEALELLRGENGREPLSRPYLVLLDIRMPRMNGLEFLDVVRSDPKLRDSVVFVLTTSKHDEDITAAYRNNIAGYILKETVGDDFIRLVSLLEAYWKIVELP